MGRKKLRTVIGILKDKASLIRAVLRLSSSTSAATHLAVLRATTHDAASPPSDHSLAALFSLGQNHRLAASVCIDALLTRLHATRSAAVALKCLIVLHGVATSRDSTFFHDHLAVFPPHGGRNFLNLSTFRESSGPDAWELSNWVRWFAAVVEQNLIASKDLGSSFSPSPPEPTNKDRNESGRLARESTSELLHEIGSLGNFVERVSDAPQSMLLQRNNLVHEAVRLASNDYRVAQHEISIRLGKLGDRMEALDSDESSKLIGVLQRLADCRIRLLSLFVNRKRNVGFWDLVIETKARFEARKREGEERRLVPVRNTGGSGDLARYAERVAGRPDQLFRMPAVAAAAGGGSWLEADLLTLTVSAVG